MFDAYAVQNMTPPYGRAVMLGHAMAAVDGTAELAAQLRFFASGFTNVVLVPTGTLPTGASVSMLPVPVLQVASANHCAMH